MKTSVMCMECNIKQVSTIAKLLNVSNDLQEEAVKRVLKELSEVSFDLTNPEIMGSITWRIITEVFGNANPYKEIKESYNQKLYDIYDELKNRIEMSDDRFDTALKLAVTGNVIDFAARHTFDSHSVFNMIDAMDGIHFALDHRLELVKQLSSCKQLLYIGDNCGEIVLDKLFIETIGRMYPDIKLYFGVRGAPVINDVTVDDAAQVNMADVAEVISSGGMYPGTILSKSSNEFQRVFNESDVVIAKGQGNYESLSDTKRRGLFLILLIKCSYIAETVSAKVMDFVIKENKK